MMTMTTELSQLKIKGELFCYEALFPEGDCTSNKHPLQAYRATADPDTMYMHQAMKQHDKR